jgi:hypothetical protein
MFKKPFYILHTVYSLSPDFCLLSPQKALKRCFLKKQTQFQAGRDGYKILYIKELRRIWLHGTTAKQTQSKPIPNCLQSDCPMCFVRAPPGSSPNKQLVEEAAGKIKNGPQALT